MIIQTSLEATEPKTLKVAQVRPELSAQLAQLVSDPTHNILWTPDLSHLFPFEPTDTHSLMPGLKLHTALLPGKEGTVSEGRRRKTEDAYLTLATAAGGLVKHQFPKAEGAISGLEFFVASYQTVTALSDPNRTTGKIAFKAAESVLAGLELVKSYLPPTIASHLQTAGFLVKIGDAVFQVYEAKKDDPSPESA